LQRKLKPLWANAVDLRRSRGPLSLLNVDHSVSKAARSISRNVKHFKRSRTELHFAFDDGHLTCYNAATVVTPRQRHHDRQRLHKVQAPFNSSTLRVAAVQIDGPLPNGKQVAFIKGRQRLVWTTKLEVDRRLNKAAKAIRGLGARHPDLDLVVLPEYAVPLEAAAPYFQRLSKELNIVIVGGGDVCAQADGEEYNQAFIFAPDRTEPLRITKTSPSKWETGLVDFPETTDNPVLSWSVNGKDYWLSVFVCLDVVLAKETIVELPGAGIVVVPMCSPQFPPLGAYVDSLLRDEAEGTAVLVVNCIGDFAGLSALYAVTRLGEAATPVLQLSPSAEGVFVAEVFLDNLSPKRITTPGVGDSVGAKWQYDLTTSSDDVLLTAATTGPSEAGDRGVLNPAIFDINGQRLRLALLTVDDLESLVEKAKDVPFEVRVISGQHDLLISHLNDSVHSLFFDARQFPLKRLSDDDGEQRIPYVEVETFFKFHGIKVSDRDRNVFVRQSVPDENELQDLLKLSTNWNDSAVALPRREKYIENRWMLGTSSVQASEIYAVMLIDLNYTGPGVSEPQVRFVHDVLPALVDVQHVVNLYQVTGHSIGAHFVLEMTGSRDDLYDIVDTVYKLAKKQRTLVRTTTCVIVKHLSNLDLVRACASEALPPSDSFYWYSSIVPVLDEADRKRARETASEHQRDCVTALRGLGAALDILSARGRTSEEINDLRKSLVTGIVLSDLQALRRVHDALQLETENRLRGIIDSILGSPRTQDILTLPQGKTAVNMTYGERIRLLSQLNTKPESPQLDAVRSRVQKLTNTTVPRNAYVHGRLEELTAQIVTEALQSHVAFLVAEEDQPR
jgi:predicted amidohydrolase